MGLPNKSQIIEPKLLPLIFSSSNQTPSLESKQKENEKHFAIEEHFRQECKEEAETKIKASNK